MMMPINFPKGRVLWLSILATGIALLGLLSVQARRFPPASVDEVYLANHAYNLYTTGSNRYSLYDDIFEKSLYQWHDATAGLIQIVYQVVARAIFVTFWGKSLTTARLSSITAAGLSLLLMGLWIRRRAGDQIAAAAMGLLLLNPIFLLASSLVRAEMVLLMSTLATFDVSGSLSRILHPQIHFGGVLGRPPDGHPSKCCAYLYGDYSALRDGVPSKIPVENSGLSRHFLFIGICFVLKFVDLAQILALANNFLFMTYTNRRFSSGRGIRSFGYVNGSVSL